MAPVSELISLRFPLAVDVEVGCDVGVQLRLKPLAQLEDHPVTRRWPRQSGAVAGHSRSPSVEGLHDQHRSCRSQI